MNRTWKQKNLAKRRLAARRANLIRNGIKESVNTKNIIDDFLSTYYGRTGIPAEELREWCRVHVRTNSAPLIQALRTLYTESYVLGQDIALSGIAKAKVNKAPSTLQQLRNAVRVTNWDNWRAGNRPAALLLRPPRGLSDLLDRSGVTIQGVDRTTLDRIGTILSRALAKGQTPTSVREQVRQVIAPSHAELARSLEVDIEDLLSDSERALSIAQTEMSRAVAVASRELYQDSGVELVEWLVAEPCDLCQENADVSPIRIDETFPSGDTEPPAHPNCVCDIAPYVVDTRDIGEEALSLILGNED